MLVEVVATRQERGDCPASRDPVLWFEAIQTTEQHRFGGNEPGPHHVLDYDPVFLRIVVTLADGGTIRLSQNGCRPRLQMARFILRHPC